MHLELFQTLLSGVAVLVAGAALGLWQILSAPDRPNYPTSGSVKRALMFSFMSALMYRGIEIVTLALDPVAPVYSTGGQVASSCLLASLMVTFLIDHLQHWLPARTHRHIQRLKAIAQCRPQPELIAARTSAMKASTGEPCPSANVVGPAIAELAMTGVRVVGPMEGPEALR